MTTTPDPSPGRGLVAAPQSEAAYEAARVLSDGGNAADAVVTGAFVQGVVDPHRCGVGGFGCATLCFQRQDGPEALAIDFHGRAGSRSRPDQWTETFEAPTPDGFGYVVRDKVNDVGYLSITVPGMVAGVAEIHRRFGSLPWKELVRRAIPYADGGFVVTPELAEFWRRPGLHGRVSTGDRLTSSEEGRKICLRDDGSMYQAGEIFRQPLLASTYRRIADEGPESFYRGDLAREISADWHDNGALVTAEDLAAYQPQVHQPLRGSYRGREILTTPLPGGGVALLQALRMLESEPLGTLGHNSVETMHRMGRILQAVWQDRLTYQGDPAFGTPADEEFLTPAYLAALATRGAEGPPVNPESQDTTQLTALDGWGNFISFSHSLGYNSGVFARGLGVLYNNCMSAFDPRPGKRNSIAPGKARSTAVAETLLLEDGRPWAAMGSPGAARITAGLVQVIVNMVDFGMSAAEAVVEPRFDAYGPGTLLVESRIPRPVVSDLDGRGWNVIQSPKAFGVVGRVYAVETDTIPPRRPVAGVDPGAPGAAFRQDQ